MENLFTIIYTEKIDWMPDMDTLYRLLSSGISVRIYIPWGTFQAKFMPQKIEISELHK